MWLKLEFGAEEGSVGERVPVPVLFLPPLWQSHIVKVCLAVNVRYVGANRLDILVLCEVLAVNKELANGALIRGGERNNEIDACSQPSNEFGSTDFDQLHKIRSDSLTLKLELPANLSVFYISTPSILHFDAKNFP